MSQLWTRRPGSLISVRGPLDEDKTDTFNFGTPAHLQPSGRFGSFPITIAAWRTFGEGTGTDTAYTCQKEGGADGLRGMFYQSATAFGSLIWCGDAATASRAIVAPTDIQATGAIADDLTPNFHVHRFGVSAGSGGVLADNDQWWGNLWQPPKRATTYFQQQQAGTDAIDDHSAVPLQVIGMTGGAVWQYAIRCRIWFFGIWTRHLSLGEIHALWRNARPDTVPGCIFFGVPTIGGMQDFSDYSLYAPTAQALGTTGMRWGEENAMQRAVWDRVLVRRRTYSYGKRVPAVPSPGSVSLSFSGSDG